MSLLGGQQDREKPAKQCPNGWRVLEAWEIIETDDRLFNLLENRFIDIDGEILDWTGQKAESAICAIRKIGPNTMERYRAIAKDITFESSRLMVLDNAPVIHPRKDMIPGAWVQGWILVDDE